MDSSVKDTGLVRYESPDISVAVVNVEPEALDLYGANELEQYFVARSSNKTKSRVLLSIIAILSIALSIAIIYPRIATEHSPPISATEESIGPSNTTVRKEDIGSGEVGISQSRRVSPLRTHKSHPDDSNTGTIDSRQSKIEMTQEAFIECVRTESLEFRLGDKFTIQQRIAEWARNPHELSRVAKDFKKQIPILSKYSVNEIEAYIIQLANTP